MILVKIAANLVLIASFVGSGLAALTIYDGPPADDREQLQRSAVLRLILCGLACLVAVQALSTL